MQVVILSFLALTSALYMEPARYLQTIWQRTERALPHLRQVASEPVTTDDLKPLHVWVLEACQRLERRLIKRR